MLKVSATSVLIRIQIRVIISVVILPFATVWMLSLPLEIDKDHLVDAEAATALFLYRSILNH